MVTLLVIAGSRRSSLPGTAADNHGSTQSKVQQPHLYEASEIRSNIIPMQERLEKSSNLMVRPCLRV